MAQVLGRASAERGDKVPGTRRPAPAKSRSRRRRRLRRIVIALLIILAVFVVTTARLFVWPQQGMPAHVDAIIMLDGPAEQARFDTALKLAREHRAPMLVISRGTPYSSQSSVCAQRIPRVKLICFNPDPGTTRGEAEFTGLLAKRYRWHSIVLVDTTPQDTRARLRVGRCFGGSIYVVNAPLPLSQWPYQIAYEWTATIKALLLQRSC